MRIFKIISTTIITLIVALIIGWFYVCYKITHEINNNYAKQEHKILDYSFNFDYAKFTGTPFNCALKLYNLTETTPAGIIKREAPLSIGYNFFTGQLHIGHSGVTQAFYKPLNAHFGTKIEGKHYYYIDIKLFQALKKIWNKSIEPFELINYIDKFSIDFGKIKAYDLQENPDDVIYVQDHIFASMTLGEHPYYKNIEQLLSDLPQNIYFDADIQIDEAPNKMFGPRSLLYIALFPHPFKLHFAGKYHPNGPITDWSQLTQNGHLSVTDFDLIATNFFINGSFEAGSNLIDSGREIKLKANINSKFDKPIMESMGSVVSYAITNIGNANIDQRIRKSLMTILMKPSKYIPKLYKMGLIQTNFDITTKSHNDLTTLIIKDLSMMNDQYGIRISNDSLIRKKADWYSEGQVFMLNYANLITNIKDYLIKFEQLTPKKMRTESIPADFLAQVMINFLPQISNYPSRSAKDLVFNYKLGSNIRQNSFGSVTMDKIPELYARAAMQELIAFSKNHPELIGQIKKLFPQLDIPDNRKVLKKQIERVIPGLIKKKTPQKTINKTNKKTK